MHWPEVRPEDRTRQRRKGASPRSKRARCRLGARASAESYLGEVVEQLARLVDCERCSILLLEGGKLRHGASIGLPDEYVTAIDGLEIGPEVGLLRRRGAHGRDGCHRGHQCRSALGRVRGTRRAARPALVLVGAAAPARRRGARHLRHLLSTSRSPRRPSRSRPSRPMPRSSPWGSTAFAARPSSRRATSPRCSALTSALDVRDDYTGLALERDLAPRARRLRPARLDDDETEMVGRVAALHDVGKLGVPTDILTSPDAADARAAADHARPPGDRRADPAPDPGHG